jgi:hypothetical protein
LTIAASRLPTRASRKATLVKKAFNLPGGTVGRLKARLARRYLRLLARAGRLRAKATIEARGVGAAPAKTSAAVRLKLKRGKPA